MRGRTPRTMRTTLNKISSNASPSSVPKVVKSSDRRATGIVNKDVYAPEALSRIRHQGSDVLFRREVAWEVSNLCARFFCYLGSGRPQCSFVTAEYHYLRTLSG